MESDDKIEELSMKVQLLPDESQKVERLHAQVTARDVELTAMRVAASK